LDAIEAEADGIADHLAAAAPGVAEGMRAAENEVPPAIHCRKCMLERPYADREKPCQGCRGRAWSFPMPGAHADKRVKDAPPRDPGVLAAVANGEPNKAAELVARKRSERAVATDRAADALSTIATNCEEFGHDAPWTSHDLDIELEHALDGLGDSTWHVFQVNGGFDSDILQALNRGWPRPRAFIDRELSGGMHGYTIESSTNGPSFWMGPFRGRGHRATLAGPELVERARFILVIPTPGQATINDAKREASKGKPKRGRPAKAKVPSSVFRTIARIGPAWDHAQLEAVSKLLECGINELVICQLCERAQKGELIDFKCPSCGSTNSRLPRTFPLITHQALPAPPSKRGRGRPRKSAQASATTS